MEFGGRGLWHWFGIISPALAPSGAAEQQKVAPGKGGGGSQADLAPTGEGRGGEGPGPGGSRASGDVPRASAVSCLGAAESARPAAQRSSAAQRRRNAIGGSSWPPTHPKNNPPAGCGPTGEENLLSHGARELLGLLQSDHRPL